MDVLVDVSWCFSALPYREKVWLRKLMAADMMCCQALGSRCCQGMKSGFDVDVVDDILLRFLLDCH